ncbi:Acg family FMN-binding oxidoreductase [Streptomyces sp. WAC00263]|uniref:Acg family FMN-binding oxidoreductase n=1 Tax=Streptomyces sp. WAC00263 TaxID=1917422 RepID=UPI0015EE8963|nr:nitroreductase [Streptomyces sp. WAC00263]KAF5990761.1 nitroreductase [Streptomyces sp. WAC00263]
MPDRQKDRLNVEAVTSLVAEATRAPSMHNAQPWAFRYLAGESVLQVRADLTRAMPRTDPRHRALYIGCGAALFNLRVAAAHAGLAAEVRLLPDPADPQLLATVRLEPSPPGPAPEEELARLYPAIRRRHTSRHPFADKDVSEPVRQALREAAAGEGAELGFADLWHADFLLELVHDAESRDSLDPAGREELDRWTRLGPEADTAVDGVPEYAFGPRKSGGKAPWRDFAGRRPVADRGTTAFEHSPHLALLSTRGDQPADWLCTGQALERVLLEATLADLATALTSHPLESPDLRELTRDPVSGLGHVQMVLRLGYGPQGPATPRRPVRDVLTLD